MELRQLEYLVAVVEEANFTRAAERMHISQSGVSAQVRQLERELGVELIDRSGRTATPTAAGIAVLDHARAALASVSAIRQTADDVNELIRGRIVVGMVVGSVMTPLFDALAAFHRAHPGVEITLVEDNSDRLVDRVRTGTLDVALIGSAAPTPAGLQALTIISDRLVAAVPVGHPLADRQRVTLADVGAHPLICLPEGTGVRTVFERACAARGITPNIALQASAPGAVADLAARGLGIAILSETIASDHTDRLIPLELDIDTPTLLALVWKSTPPALRELLRHCRHTFDEGAPTDPEQDLTGARFEHVSLRGATFTEVSLNDARMHAVDLTGAKVRDALFNGTRMRGVELVDVEISGELRNVVVNGIDIAPLVDAELNRRMPERAKMRPADSGGFGEAWAILERLWEGTVARARTFPEAALHRGVDDEWSFIQTLRHLNFASAAWVGRMILGNPSPWHQLDLPWDGAPGWDGILRDREARPPLDEVLTVRRERQAMVRHVIESLTDEQLASAVTCTEPGWPQVENFPYKDCLRIVLNEEWEHRLYAERDLTSLENEN